MQRKKAAAKSPAPIPPVNDEKLAMIRSGKKKKTITGFKENKNVTFENKGGKFVVVEKEKKFEEAGVTEKKRNYIKFESKLGTEKETDLTKIAGAKKQRAIEPRQEETIVQKRKVNEYLDNYQYHETKDFKKADPKPSVVIHQRLGDIIGGTYEESSYERQTVTTAPDGKRTVMREKQSTVTRNPRPTSSQRDRQNKTNTKDMKQIKSTTNLRGNPRSGAGESTSTTTKTTTKTTTRTTKVNGDKPAATEEYKKVRRTRVTKGGETTTTTETTTSKK